MKGYRPDIDGLRAVAVISVLIFHYWPALVPGGFAGVDVFFVISGYLITGKLANDIDANGYEIWPLIARFYHDRIKRIFPAALAMLVAALITGWFLLTPGNYAALGESAAYSAFGIGNVYFYIHTNYFDQQSEMLPLLHMWSLGVEEQFYLAWPFIIAAAMWFSRSRRWLVVALIIIISIASLFAAVVVDPNAAFYLPWSRAWELGIGAALAFLPNVENKVASELLGIAGLSMVAAILFLLDGRDGVETSLGIALFPAVFGSAMLVMPRQENWVASCLSLPLVRFIGKISYSLYLWHWPVLVFFRHYSFGKPPTPPEALSLGAISFILALLSWRFIEPIRRVNLPHTVVIRTGIAAMCVTALVAGTVEAEDGLPHRIPPQAQKLLHLKHYGIAGNPPDCSISSNKTPKCLAYNGDKMKILVLGDSYAGHLIPGLQDQFPNAYITKIGATGCRPVIDGIGKRSCIRLMKEAFYGQIPEGHFDAIILAGRWLGSGIKTIRKTVDYLDRFGKVYVIGSPMEYDAHLPDLLMSKYLVRKPDQISYHSLLAKVRATDADFREQLAGSKATFVTIVDTICKGSTCETLTPSGIPYQFDYGHMTMEGSREVMRRLVHGGFLSSDMSPAVATN